MTKTTGLTQIQAILYSLMRFLSAALVSFLISGCTLRIAMYDERPPVVPSYSLEFGSNDTTLTATLTMLSDKLQVLDVTRIENDTAFRVARLMLDTIIEPYNGGALNVHVTPCGKEAWGYVVKARLLDYGETPLSRQAVRNQVNTLLRKQGKRISRLIRNKGLDGWETDGYLRLEGYDSDKKVAIYSMAGWVDSKGNLEHEPLLVVWASPEGKLLKAWLTIVTRRLERS